MALADLRARAGVGGDRLGDGRRRVVGAGAADRGGGLRARRAPGQSQGQREHHPGQESSGAPRRTPPAQVVSRAAIVPPSSYADSRSAGTHVTEHLQHRRGLPPGQGTDDRLHRADGSGRVVATVDPQPVGPLPTLARARRAVAGEGAAGLEEDRVEEVLEGAAHVAEVGRRPSRKPSAPARRQQSRTGPPARPARRPRWRRRPRRRRRRRSGCEPWAWGSGGPRAVGAWREPTRASSVSWRVLRRRRRGVRPVHGAVVAPSGGALRGLVGRLVRAARPRCRVRTGALTEHLVALVGAAQVAAIDPSEPFVVACRSRHPGVDVRLGAAESLPFDDDTFDVTAACLVVHFMTDPIAGLAEMKRVTRTGDGSGRPYGTWPPRVRRCGRCGRPLTRSRRNTPVSAASRVARERAWSRSWKAPP